MASVLAPEQPRAAPAGTDADPTRGERYGTAMLRRLPWLALALIAGALIAVGADAVSNDTWVGIASGRELLRHGFDLTNTWTRFGTRDWVDQQWGAHVIFFTVWRIGGAAGLVALHVALLTAGLGLCLRAAARRGGGPVWSAALLLLVAVTDVGELVFVRAQSFSVFAFGLLAWLLARDDGRLEPRVLLALPLLVTWSNLHGAVLVGAGVCVLYAASCVVETRGRGRGVVLRALALASGACAACFASPVGAELPGYLRRMLANGDFRHYATEWQSVTLANSPLFVVAALLAGAVALRAPIARRDKVLVLALTLAGFTAIRSELWATLAWLAVLPAALERMRPFAGARRLRSAAGALGLIAPASVLLAIGHDVRDGPRTFSASWPPAAARVVQSQLGHDPALRIFADEPLADWLLVAAPASRGRLAIDARFETFHHQTFVALAAIRNDPPRIASWIADEDAYVLDPAPGADGRLVHVLERQAGVVTLYRSARVVVLRRTSG